MPVTNNFSQAAEGRRAIPVIEMSKLPRPYRAAIIGCGRIAGGMDGDPLRSAIWTHAGAYTAHPCTELVAAADQNLQALDAFGKRWGISRLYQDATELLAQENVEILSICTWSDSHRDIAEAGARAGVKAIWCEKPIASSLDEADQMLESCRDLVLAVNHVRRWDACYLRARELLQQGKIGRLQGAVCVYSGGISNIGTHLFDTLNYLLGPATSVWAHPVAVEDLPDPDPSGDILFQGGAVAHVIGCNPRSYLVFEVDIWGTEGRLRLLNNGHKAELWGVADSPRYSNIRELEFRGLVHEGDEGRRMVDAVSDIIHCIEHGGRPRCSGEDGRASLELTAAFIESCRSERRVHLPLEGQYRRHKAPVR